jgi:hypothetical protein
MTDGASAIPDTTAGENLPETTRRLTEEGWDFGLLSAAGHIPMGRAARFLGIPEENIITNDPTPEGISWMADQAGSFISMSRSGEKAHFV